MKVALQTGQLRQPVPGGIGRYVEGLLAHLPAGGIEVEPVAGTRWRYQAWHRFRRPALRLPDGIDVVHAPSLAVPPPGSRPLVVTIHDLAFSYLSPRGAVFHRRGLELAREEAAAVVVPSAFTASEVVAAGIDAVRIHVVHHGIDPPAQPPAAEVAGRLRRLGVEAPFLLAVGTIEPRKGLDLVAEAFSSLHGVRLVLAGPPGWGEVAGLDRPGVVRAGQVDQADLDALYRGALALVMASHTEGFGLPALEAMVRGCPVVVSDAGSLPEVVDGAGLVVPAGDPDTLGGVLAEVAGNDDLRQRLSAAGLRRAASFTWAACVEGHLTAYRAALGPAGDPS
jgi:glycosyltransferase involved in cell wall biosynthesis